MKSDTFWMKSEKWEGQVQTIDLQCLTEESQF